MIKRFYKFCFFIITIFVGILMILYGQTWDTYSLDEKIVTISLINNVLELDPLLNELSSDIDVENCKVQEDKNLLFRCHIVILTSNVLVYFLFFLLLLGFFSLWFFTVVKPFWRKKK